MYSSKYYTCEEIDERLLQGYYDDAVAAGYEGTKEEFLEELNRLLQNPRINANLVDILPGSGLTSVNAQQAFAEIAREIYPVQVAIASSNAGVYEVGDAQHSITPQIVLSITRNNEDVSSSAQTTSSQGSVQSDNKTITGPGLSSGTTTFQISVTQGGQTVDAPDQKFSFMNYRYRGAVSANNIPSDAIAKTNYVKQLCQNNTISKELSTSTQLTGKNALAAGKCYVFVIPTQSPNMIVKNANSGGTVDNAGSGTFELARVNGTGTVNCKYVIVPASSNAWNFEITNS